MLKASLPNEWSYELAEEIVRDYVQRIFIDKTMCAVWQSMTARTTKDKRIDSAPTIHIESIANAL